MGKGERQQVSTRLGGVRSTGIEVHRAGQAEAQEAEKFDGGVDGVRAAVEITQAVESLDRQSQAGNQPDQEQAVGVVVTDMFQRSSGI